MCDTGYQLDIMFICCIDYLFYCQVVMNGLNMAQIANITFTIVLHLIRYNIDKVKVTCALVY